MRKSGTVISLLAVIFISLLATRFIFLPNKQAPKVSGESITNTFLPMNGSYTLRLGEAMPFNLKFIYSEDQRDSLKEISSIYIGSTRIEAEGFTVNGDVRFGNYHIKTLSLTILGKSLGEKELTKITITTPDGNKVYDIGTVGFEVIEEENKQETLALVEAYYPAVQNNQSAYYYSFKNEGAAPLNITKIAADLNGEPAITLLEPLSIRPQEVAEGEIQFKENLQQGSSVVTVLRPVIYYQDGSENRLMLAPPTWYIPDMTDEIIEKTIVFSKGNIK